jgi:hypothetical protein
MPPVPFPSMKSADHDVSCLSSLLMIASNTLRDSGFSTKLSKLLVDLSTSSSSVASISTMFAQPSF